MWLKTRLPAVLVALFSLGALSGAVPASRSASFGRPKFDWLRTKYFYAFGDSYTFVGGTKGYPKFRLACNRRLIKFFYLAADWLHSFIGSAFNFSYTPEDLLEDEIQFNVVRLPSFVSLLTIC